MNGILSETLFDLKNPIFRIEFFYFSFRDHGVSDGIQTLDNSKMRRMHVFGTRITAQRKRLNGTNGCDIAGPGEEILPGDNPEISPLDEVSARLMVSRVENEIMGLVLVFHGSRGIVI